MYKLELKLDNPFDLDVTLDCGQTFRWTKDGNWWNGVVRDTVLSLCQLDNRLLVKSSNDKLLGYDLDIGIWKYLGLEDDLEKIEKLMINKISSMPDKPRVISENAIKEGHGLRILRQDPLEMAVEYIMSTRNNIPTIRRMANELSKNFSANRVDFNEKIYYKFPNFEQLKTLKVEDLTKIKLAFRVPWLYELFQKFDSESYFTELKKLDLEEKLEKLMENKGIGFKVASCITLFAYGELNSFPVDIWISRVMEDLFEIKGSTRKVMKAGMEMFSPIAGYYQEVLFRYYRTNQLRRK